MSALYGRPSSSLHYAHAANHLYSSGSTYHSYLGLPQSSSYSADDSYFSDDSSDDYSTPCDTADHIIVDIKQEMSDCFILEIPEAADPRSHRSQYLPIVPLSGGFEPSAPFRAKRADSDMLKRMYAFFADPFSPRGVIDERWGGKPLEHPPTLIEFPLDPNVLFHSSQSPSDTKHLHFSDINPDSMFTFPDDDSVLKSEDVDESSCGLYYSEPSSQADNLCRDTHLHFGGQRGCNNIPPSTTPLQSHHHATSSATALWTPEPAGISHPQSPAPPYYLSEASPIVQSTGSAFYRDSQGGSHLDGPQITASDYTIPHWYGYPHHQSDSSSHLSYSHNDLHLRHWNAGASAGRCSGVDSTSTDISHHSLATSRRWSLPINSAQQRSSDYSSSYLF